MKDCRTFTHTMIPIFQGPYNIIAHDGIGRPMKSFAIPNQRGSADAKKLLLIYFRMPGPIPPEPPIIPMPPPPIMPWPPPIIPCPIMPCPPIMP